MADASSKSQELAAIVREIRDRVRQQYPEGEAKGIGVPLPDLLPILHARDAAEAKVAAIGSVNPRAGGPINSLIQLFKRQVARSLQWFVRDQVTFNRAVLTTLEAVLESMNEINRTFVALGQRNDELRQEFRREAEILKAEASEIKDMRVHWLRWREEWEKKLYQNEIHFLRGVADTQAAFDHKLLHTDAAYRDLAKRQHGEFLVSLNEGLADLEQRFWHDLEKVRLEYERVIHNELRVVRQKAAAVGVIAARGAAPASVTPNVQSTPAFDYTRFADRFRGTEERVRQTQQVYVPYFSGRSNVLDIGCGRGEFLETMREAGVSALGIDLDAESVNLCRSRGLKAEVADLFQFLADAPDAHFDGIFASQVVEHIPVDQVPAMIALCSAKLQRGGLLILETPNPECLAIFATHFYLDPTHVRPLPPSLLVFYFEESGLGAIEIKRLSPAIETMPSLAELPAEFREAFFGSLDYAIVGRKL